MSAGPPIVITISGFGERERKDLLDWLKEMLDWERVILVNASTFSSPGLWLDNDLHPGDERLVRVEGWEWNIFPPVNNSDQVIKMKDWELRGKQLFAKSTIIFSYPAGSCFHNGQEFKNVPERPIMGHTY